MALVGNISGSNGTMNVAITGSLVVANRPDASFPALPLDAVLFISGNRGNGVGSGRNVSGTSVFGGDVVISGTIAAQDGIGGFSPVKILDDIALTGSLYASASLVLSSSTTPKAPSATESAIYVKSVGGLPQLYAKNGSAAEFQIAASATSVGSAGAVQFAGSTAGSFNSDGNSFFWDNTNKILSVANLQVTGSTFVVTSANITVTDPVVLIGSGAISNNAKSIIAFTSGTDGAVSLTGQSLIFGANAAGGLSAAQMNVQNGTISAAAIDFTTLVPVRASKFEVGGSTAFISSSNGTELALDAGTGTINIGSSNSNRTVNVGTGAAVQTITVGSQNSSSALTLQAGLGNVSITGAPGTTYTIGAVGTLGTTTIGQSTDTNIISIGNANTADTKIQTINIGAGTPVLTGRTSITIGNNLSSTAVNIAAGTGNISIGGAVTTTYTIGTTTGQGEITLGRSTDSNTISIGNANTADTKTQTINIGAGSPAATGKAVITIGNTNGASKIDLKAGTDFIVAWSNLVPNGDRTLDLGSQSARWRNIYTGDLHLKNERGDYTLIEEEDFLSIRFNKTGKRYKFLLEPVPELDEK